MSNPKEEKHQQEGSTESRNEGIASPPSSVARSHSGRSDITTPPPPSITSPAARPKSALSVPESPLTTKSIKSQEVTPRQTNASKTSGAPRNTGTTKGASAAPRAATTSRDAATSTAAISQTNSPEGATSLPAESPGLEDTILPTPKPPSKCPLFCCFYAEFDNKVGPRICYQSPRNFMDRAIDLSLDRVHDVLAETFDELLSKHAWGEDANKTAIASLSKNLDTKASEESRGVELPNGTFSIFDSCSEYIITGNELSGKIVNLSTHNFHVLTRPTIISDERFERNSLFFCVGFVLRRTEDPRPFRPVLSRLASTLHVMEHQSHFLSNDTTRSQLQKVLEQVFVSLNSPQWECNMVLNQANILNLKLFHPPKVPAFPVPDYAVPVFLRRDWQVQMYDWDLSINWVLLHIDGVTNARQISKNAEIDMEMVRACLRVLKHHGLIALVDMFFFSNRYECTDTAAAVLAGRESKLLQDAVDFCIKRKALVATPGADVGSPQLHSSSPAERSMSSSQRGAHPGSFRFASFTSNYSNEMMMHHIPVQRREDYVNAKIAIAELYSACHRATTYGDLWLHLVSSELSQHTSQIIDWSKMFHLIDHRRFTLFGLVHGLLRRVHDFPMVVDRGPTSKTTSSRSTSGSRQNGRDRSRTRNERSQQDSQRLSSEVVSMMDGKHCDDELVCRCERPLEELYDLVETSKVFSIFATTDGVSE